MLSYGQKIEIIHYWDAGHAIYWKHGKSEMWKYINDINELMKRLIQGSPIKVTTFAHQNELEKKLEVTVRKYE